MRKILFLVCLFSFLLLEAQQSKINFGLKYELAKQTNKNTLFPLFVIGEVPLIKQEVRKLKGQVIRSSGNIVQVKLPIKHIEDFSQNDFVQSIPYSFSRGQLLSDTMTIHNNVTPIHNGVPPLLRAYTGKNVVFGIIDTGQDIVHPDFKDTLGNTRIYRIWDQVTGLYWDSTSINNGTCTHVDNHVTSHGTHVSGIGAGNGLGLNKYAGVAGEATIVAVASDFNAPNWLSTVVDATAYIYSVADSLGLPCVINASIGDYFGSHDGTDPAGVLIDSLVNYKPGRAFVCAAGNAGFFNWHVEHNVTLDTTFTWLKYNPTSALGFGSVFYEIWADTADFNNVDFAFGANLPSGTFEERGRTAFTDIQNSLGNKVDYILNTNNDTLAVVETYGELQDDKYLLQVLLNEPDSNTYNFSVLSTGAGRFDFWSTTLLGTSDVVETGLPSVGVYPPIQYYIKPDSAKTMVSSFTCHPTTIAVANFVNRKTYIDVDTILRVMPETPGELAPTSSFGPDRRGNTKPDIAASGEHNIGPNTASVIAANMASTPANRQNVAYGAMHRRNGGTSMASPVVAGTVALYLEKCPNATMTEIKAAIQNTGRQDAYTGILPNYAFGYGKVDAFEALIHSNYTFSLGADINICEDDSTLLSAPLYSVYEWSTGDTSQSIYLDTTQTVYVTVTNLSGCKGRSDTITSTWRPLPVKPIVTVVGNDTLVYSSSLNLQWYYNNSIIGGETDTFHIAQNNGDYFLEVTDTFGCKNNSDTVNIIVLGIENTSKDVAFIYPNPSSGSITVNINKENIEAIKVVNVLGKVVADRKINNNQTEISFNLTDMAEGIYYIKLITSNEEYIQKVILLR